MSLKDKIAAIKGKSPPRPPEIREALRLGTEQLRASGIQDRVLKEGDHVPEFALPNQDQVIVTSRELLTRAPLVLAFYRGHW